MQPDTLTPEERLEVIADKSAQLIIKSIDKSIPKVLTLLGKLEAWLDSKLVD